MRRPATGLWKRITSFEALWRASRLARRGKRRMASAAAFEHHLEAELLALQAELRDGSYRCGAYREFTVHEPTERLIRAAPYRDRVVHHALVWELEPLLERQMIDHSFACRLGKGTHRAIATLQRFLRGGSWVLKVDLRKYFYTVDHALLLEDLDQVAGDDAVRALIRQIIASYDAGPAYYFPVPGDDLFAVARPRGLPIGNLTSQLFANAFLSPVDRWLKRDLGWKRYVRYMDDLVFVGQSREEMQAVRCEIDARLAVRRLVVHQGKTQVLPVRNGVAYLGFHLYPYQRRIRRPNLQRFTRRLRAQQRGVAEGRLDLEHVRRSLSAWLGYADPVRHERLLERLLERPVFQVPGSAAAVRFTAHRPPPA